MKHVDMGCVTKKPLSQAMHKEQPIEQPIVLSDAFDMTSLKNGYGFQSVRLFVAFICLWEVVPRPVWNERVLIPGSLSEAPAW